MLPLDEARYAVGNRVYRGGSSAPTRGTVDPMGYVERELSNKRSKLAAAALRRTESAKKTMTTRTPTPVAKPKPIAVPPKPKPPVVSKTGALKPKPVAAPKPLPFDPQGSDETIDANSSYMNILSTLLGKEQGINRDYTTATRDAQIAEPERLTGLLNNFGSRGMARSSGYGTAYSGEQNAYARKLSDLATAHTQGLNDIATQRNSARQTLTQTLAAIQRASGRRLSTKAGDLGLK